MKLKHVGLSATLLIVCLTGTAAFAGDMAAGKSKSATCSSCHGGNGISSMDLWPNLAGQKAAYLAKQLRAFRDGTRNDAVMAGMAKALSDTDIEDLAAYYASLPGSAN